MGEDDEASRRRRELRQEKEKLAGFSRRLATLLEQVQDVDSVPEYQDSDGHCSSTLPADYRQPFAASFNSDSDVEMARDDDSGGAGSTMPQLPPKRLSNSGSVVELM